MNIFFLDEDPMLAAKYHCDRHCVKMVLETAQILSTVSRQLNLFPDFTMSLYKETHKNHPCTKWARESRENFIWLVNLGFFLCQEYYERYGKAKEKSHACQNIIYGMIGRISENYLLGKFSKIERTPFALAMPNECKISSNAVDCYRTYYMTNKRHLAKWKTQVPYWWR